ncbi:hypothetical protein BGZ96_009439 [Linnemannia gamsii]|uniref:Uncharacterized protein n=1 Tax=Linnemannia gamsii TaxID=64522 RepID=A0ABQ7JW72_9FUNG|nr:hypothetical protein BGZ96_009439 [Linnemannia gamsii]
MAAKSNGSSVMLRLKERAEECRGSGNEEERGSGGKHEYLGAMDPPVNLPSQVPEPNVAVDDSDDSGIPVYRSDDAYFLGTHVSVDENEPEDEPVDPQPYEYVSESEKEENDSRPESDSDSNGWQGVRNVVDNAPKAPSGMEGPTVTIHFSPTMEATTNGNLVIYLRVDLDDEALDLLEHALGLINAHTVHYFSMFASIEDYTAHRKALDIQGRLSNFFLVYEGQISDFNEICFRAVFDPQLSTGRIELVVIENTLEEILLADVIGNRTTAEFLNRVEGVEGEILR